MTMIEFARRNAGVAAAVAAYAALGGAGVLAVQQMADPSHRLPIAAPPAASPSSTSPGPPQASPSSPGHSVSPTKTPPSASPAPASTLVVAAQDTSTGHPAGSGGSGGSNSGGNGTSGGGGGGQTSTPPTTRPTCAPGRVAAVTLPLGVLPCDTVRVGRAVTIGGTK